MNLAERAAFERAVLHLTNATAACRTSAASTPRSAVRASRRRQRVMSVRPSSCPTTTLCASTCQSDEVEERMESGESVVSATFVTPYPPGFPVLVPGQVFSKEILSFMRSLDTPEIHGYEPALGYRVYTSKALEMVARDPAIDSLAC